MSKRFFTPVGYLLRNFQQKEGLKTNRVSKETEPVLSESTPISSNLEQEQEPVRESETQPMPTTVEVVPELPEIDQDLLDEGVELYDHDTIFVNARKIDLPLPLENVNEGLTKPITSGWRWMSELTKYILARFHIVIKKVGGKFKLIEQN